MKDVSQEMRQITMRKAFIEINTNAIAIRKRCAYYIFALFSISCAGIPMVGHSPDVLAERSREIAVSTSGNYTTKIRQPIQQVSRK